jgi:hypothetical protein
MRVRYSGLILTAIWYYNDTKINNTDIYTPITKILVRHGLFTKPLTMWPHAEVLGYASTALTSAFMQAWSASPIKAYGPEDLAELAADQSKRDIFVKSRYICQI